MQLARSNFRLLLLQAGFVAGCCFLLLAIGYAGCEAFFLTHSAAAQGTILANIEKETADTRNGTPSNIVDCPQFRYQSADGVTHIVTSSACAYPPRFRIGDRIGIHYANWNPSRAQTDTFGARWGLALGFGSAGLILTPIGFILLRRLHPQGHPPSLAGFQN